MPGKIGPVAVAVAFGATALGVAFSDGWPLCLGGVVAAIISLRAQDEASPPLLRRAAWLAFSAAVLAVLTIFTVRVAVPNIVSAGNEANHGVAVSTLRTFLWTEDQYIKRAGRPGNLYDLGAPVPSENGQGTEPPLLRAVLRPLPADEVPTVPGQPKQAITVFTGYAYRIDVTGAHYLAYAWPVLPGRSGHKVYCLDDREDIFESESADRTPRYAGLGAMPAWDACLPKGAHPGDRPVDGVGGDGVAWHRWKNRPTRRAKDAPSDADPRTDALEKSPPGGAPSAP